jgi:hypothetical protein
VAGLAGIARSRIAKARGRLKWAKWPIPTFAGPRPDPYNLRVSAEDKQEFRLHPWLRHAVWVAIGGWVLLLLAMLWLREPLPVRAYVSVVFFIVLFAAVLAFYSGLTITVDRYGVTYRGLLSFESYPFESILKVDVRPGISGLVTYDVITRRGMLQFSSFIRGHQALRDLIVSRAGLEAS